MGLFVAKTRDEEASVLRQQAPSDKIFNTKNIEGSNLFKLFKALAFETTRLDEIISEYWQGTDLLTTQNEDYIKLWEEFVLIPDSIFTETISLTLDARREQILLKLKSLGVLTEQEFIDLALILGYTIQIKQGMQAIYPPYSVPFIPIGNEKQARFIWFISGLGSLSDYPPYSVPFTPKSSGFKLKNLFDILKPSNTRIIYLS